MHEQKTDSMPVAEATKKTADTAPKGLGDAPAHREGFFKFFGEVRRETSKVTWPTWKETWLTTVVVFIMVGLLMLFFFFIDFILSLGEKWLIGLAS
jgi:preprotein translocase subunit SecE